MSIPVVMVHGGRVRPNQNECKWLVWTLRQAKEYNQWVILLGSPRMEQCAKDAGVGFYNYFERYYTEAQHFFDKVYVKLSHYPTAYDRAVLERYFVLKEFMRDHELERVWNLDSDVMVYRDLFMEAEGLPYTFVPAPPTAESEHNYTHYEPWAAYCIPIVQHEYRLSASAHVAWFSREGIWAFCQFMEHMYTDPDKFDQLNRKWRWHQRESKPGGVCDMTHLYLFSREHSLRVVNLTDAITPETKATHEHNLHVSENGLPDEFRMKDGRKEIEWRAGKPYGFSLRQKRWIRFKTLHLQGRAKSLAQSYFWPRRCGN